MAGNRVTCCPFLLRIIVKVHLLFYLHYEMPNWKRYIPTRAKLAFKLQQQWYTDVYNGTSKRFARQFSTSNNLKQIISINQEIRTNESTLNKIHNLSLAVQKMDMLVIQPGQIFSFWSLVGNPSEKNGYKKSRTIINEKLDVTTGGGLCQLSGLIYFLALQAGLTITERHPHSIDIYTEEERFTPLGSDATVSYGYKDLRFINNLPHAIMLQFELNSTSLCGQLLSAEKIPLTTIEFIYRKEPAQIHVTTLHYNNGQLIILDQSTYRLLTIA
jgi:vancomycin resistance protein VanW